MKTSLLPAAAALLLAGTGCGSRSAAPAPEPIRLIVETDMGNDIDDALAFDLIYKAMDDGRVDLLAIGNHKLSPTATDYIDILNTWYGYPDIPLAQSPTPVLNDHAPDYTAAVCAMTREDGSPAFARSKTPEQIEDPVTLYRRTLAAQPDCSVTVLSLGFATELAKLLDSPADDISPLTGRELVARKVKYFSVMAGSFGVKKRAEYNVINDIPAARKFFAECPSPIVLTPFEIGKQVVYPGRSIAEDFGWAEHHPMVEAYKAYHEMPYDRPTWDMMSVLYVLRPEMFGVSEPGIICVDDQGYTYFTPTPRGKHTVLTLTPGQQDAVLRFFVRELSSKPAKYR